MTHAGLVFDEPLLSPAELAKDLNRSARWVRTQIGNKTLPYLKMGGRYYFRPSEVRRHLAINNTVIPTGVAKKAN